MDPTNPLEELRPEIRGAVSLAVKCINKAAERRVTKYRKKTLWRKWQEKAQRHIARAERYSKAGAA